MKTLTGTAPGRRATIVLGLALLALAAPAAASAHATLVRTAPPNGAVLRTPPRAVTVLFDDTVLVGHGNAAVDNATNESIAAGPAHARGRVLTIPLRPHLGHGAYSVRWSIVSDDGHLEQGVLAFAVGAGSATPHAVLQASSPLGWWAVVFRIAFYLGLLVAAGVTVFAISTRGLGLDRRPLAHLLFFSLLLAFLGASGLVHGATSGTRNAHVLTVALVVALAGAAAAALAPRVTPLLPVAGACALALLAAPTLAGHALDRDQPWALSVPADLAHLLAAATWLGGLVALLLVGRRAVAAVSRNALAAVVVLAVSGVLRALTELRAVDQIWTTSYGRALVVKTALFVPLVTLGFVNRTQLLAVFERLRRNVRVEVLLLAVVVGVVAVLVQLRPGKAATRAAAPTLATIVPRPPALPRSGVVDARELGPLAVAVARTADAATVTLLGQDGTGASGRSVRIDGRAAAACGAGCYRGPTRAGPLHVIVDGRALTFDVPARAPSARAMLARATRLYRSARTIVFTESLRSSPSAGIVTRFDVEAPDSLRYVIRNGPQAVVLGTRRWDRDTPTGSWRRSQQTPLDVTAPYWRVPQDVHLVAPHTITFVDRTIPAWFRLTVGPDGRPRALRMTAAAHFMHDRYLGYDVPVVLSPPSR